MEVGGVTAAAAFLIGLEINTGKFKYSKPFFNADLSNMDSIIRVKINAKNYLRKWKFWLNAVCQTRYSSIGKIPLLLKKLQPV
jgi:hypothetical protein